MEKEIWKDIHGYEGLYQASTMGRIRSMDREVFSKNGRVQNLKGKILKPDDNNNSLRVLLSNDSNKQRYNVHKLIIFTFKGMRPEDYDICHGNGDYTDNRLENLRYDTKSQNQIDMYRYGNKNGKGKLSIEQVLKIRKLHATGNYTQTKLAEMFKVTIGAIGRIVNRKTFTWLNEDGTIDESNTAVS